MPLTDQEWARLVKAHNNWVDDVGDILQGLEAAAEVAQRSIEGAPSPGGVVADLRRRVEAAILEISERTNEMTLVVSRLQRDD